MTERGLSPGPDWAAADTCDSHCHHHCPSCWERPPCPAWGRPCPLTGSTGPRAQAWPVRTSTGAWAGISLVPRPALLPSAPAPELVQPWPRAAGGPAWMTDQRPAQGSGREDFSRGVMFKRSPNGQEGAGLARIWREGLVVGRPPDGPELWGARGRGRRLGRPGGREAGPGGLVLRS